MRQQTRRLFLKEVGAMASTALAFPAIVPARVWGQDAPSNRITVGCIGMGGRGAKPTFVPF